MYALLAKKRQKRLEFVRGERKLSDEFFPPRQPFFLKGPVSVEPRPRVGVVLRLSDNRSGKSRQGIRIDDHVRQDAAAAEYGAPPGGRIFQRVGHRVLNFR